MDSNSPGRSAERDRELMTQILARIDALLQTRGLSDKRASDLAGCPDAIRNFRRMMEGANQRRSITVHTLAALADVFAVPLPQLMFGDGPAGPRTPYAVAGYGPFPLALLARDQAYPADEASARALCAPASDKSQAPLREVHLISRRLGGPDLAAWRAAGWALNPEAAPPAVSRS